MHINSNTLLLIGDSKLEIMSELDLRFPDTKYKSKILLADSRLEDRIGNEFKNKINIPCGNMVDNIKEVIECIYPDLPINYAINDCESSILAPKNIMLQK